MRKRINLAIFNNPKGCAITEPLTETEPKTDKTEPKLTETELTESRLTDIFLTIG
ncbi:hypothetical protein HanIR_Chr14g0717881 [Helianthus annuus]|nr:hypothetical protein HanIR_Chr14g0717881 [Helianthus annuus]